DVRVPREQPCQGKLRRRGSLLDSDLTDMIDKRNVLGEVLPLEPRVAATPVVRRHIVDGAEPSGQEAATERAIGDECDFQLTQCWNQLVLGVPGPQRVLGLDGGNWMDLV